MADNGSTDAGEFDFDDGSDHCDRWVDGLLRYRFRPGVVVLSDPRHVLVAGTGAAVWAAGKVLAAFLASHPEICQGATCLELGSGVGAVGLTAAALGAKLVILTDLEYQLPLLKRNQQESCPQGDRVQVRALDWRCPEHQAGLSQWAKTWSLVLGADVGYDPDLFDHLVGTLESQCSTETVVYLALADRGAEEENEPTVQDFVDVAQEFFECEEVLARQLEPHQSTTRVLRLRRKQGLPQSVSGSCSSASHDAQLVTFGLVGGHEQGTRVDRKSVLGNPFFDKSVELWETDCRAYSEFLDKALTEPDDHAYVDVDSIAKHFGVTVSKAWQPVQVWYVKEEVKRLRACVKRGTPVRLLCHCQRPFPELDGRESPCHAYAIADRLLGESWDKSSDHASSKRGTVFHLDP
mmetsp:Transcript_14640/g.37912  ORF Transcript_14640/g.37912 Transcript_14640/m.37912 type:complete len:407 (-) Transcript_14640:20-1240(-)